MALALATGGQAEVVSFLPLTAENGRVTILPNLKNKDAEPKEYAVKRVLESESAVPKTVELKDSQQRHC